MPITGNQIIKVLLFVASLFSIQSWAQKLPDNRIQELNFLAGTWAAQYYTQSTEGNWELPPPITSADTVTMSFSLYKKGKYIKGNMGGKYAYEWMFSYDVLQQKFRMSSIDQVSGLLDIYEGKFQDEALVVDNVVKDTYYKINDTKVYNRLSIKMINDFSFDWLIEDSKDNGVHWGEVAKVRLSKKNF